MAINKKGKLDLNIFIALGLLLIGFFSSFIIFMGIVLKNPDLTFIGGLILGGLGLVVSVVERFLR